MTICDCRHSPNPEWLLGVGGNSEPFGLCRYGTLILVDGRDRGVGLSTRQMASTEPYPVYVVVGICGDQMQYWAAAVSRRRAAREVGNVLGPEWKTTVLDWRLTPERLAKLNLTRNSVRKIAIVEGFALHKHGFVR
jgi:hypothetical protein